MWQQFWSQAYYYAELAFSSPAVAMTIALLVSPTHKDRLGLPRWLITYKDGAGTFQTKNGHPSQY